MSIALTTHEGRVALEIEDRKGEIHLYLFTCSSREAGWGVRLAKIDPETRQAEIEHTITLGPGDRWECTCNDWKYRRKLRLLEGGCKHILASRELKACLAAITGVNSNA